MLIQQRSVERCRNLPLLLTELGRCLSLLVHNLNALLSYHYQSGIDTFNFLNQLRDSDSTSFGISRKLPVMFLEQLNDLWIDYRQIPGLIFRSLSMMVCWVFGSGLAILGIRSRSPRKTFG